MKTGKDTSADKHRALLAGWQAPDLLGIGVVVCDASCQMLIANQTALDILAARDGLWLNSDGRLLETDKASQILEDVVERCSRAASSADKMGRGCFSVTVRRASAQKPLTLLARPFRPAARAGSSSMTLLLLLDFPHAIEGDGIGPLLRFVTASDNWGGSLPYREGVQ
jgi:hypothetical protein